ncbi:MAG: DUF123 domain-containing protein [Rhodocyclaceae bacterium]|nr:DUF123 domain-containing protein [Rhodocyclaceae bacterium]
MKNWRNGLADMQGRAMTSKPIPRFKTVRVGRKSRRLLAGAFRHLPVHSAEGAIKPLFRPTCWHIDYLFDAMEARVTRFVRAERDECEMNQTHPGIVLVPGFGASDCRKGCGSHLKYLGVLPPAPPQSDIS